MTAGADSTCCHARAAVPIVRGSGIQVPGGAIQLSGPVSARRDYDRLTQLEETQTSEFVQRVWALVSAPLNQTSVGADIGVHHEIVGRHLLTDSRNQARQRMWREATSRGANAVIAMRLAATRSATSCPR